MRSRLPALIPFLLAALTATTAHAHSEPWRPASAEPAPTTDALVTRAQQTGTIAPGVCNYDFVSTTTGRGTYDGWGSGLFQQRDPSGFADSVNLYAGFAWDPINNRDPTGRLTYNADEERWSTDGGDTIDSIARDTGFSADSIDKENPDITERGKALEAGEPIALPSARRIRILEGAAKLIGSRDYALRAERGTASPGDWKCNIFVGELLDRDGKAPRISRSGWRKVIADQFGCEESYITTDMLANKRGAIPGCPVTPASKAKPGCTMPYPPPKGERSGHTMIWTRNIHIVSNGVLYTPSDGGTIGAGEHTMNDRTMEYHKKKRRERPVFREVHKTSN